MTDCGEDIGESLEDARKLIKDLREKSRAQAQQILAWRRAYKMQEVLITRLNREKADQMKTLSSKLLLFESRLIRKQKDISVMLNHREVIIHRQQRIIETLTNRLIDNGLEPPVSDLTELDTNILDLESLNDSDSAVVMEEDAEVHIPKFRNSDSITVVRSISDAIDPNLKYTIRRSNGFLRRPEILETVYSVEEDGDNDNSNSIEVQTEVNKKRDAFASGSAKAIVTEEPEKTAPPDWSPYERSDKPQDDPKVTTYNRVMSNHRSVTKPKDVKYKRINKAKSKSLEELRGRLKNWVEQGSKMAGISLEHSQSYA
ncbi:PREDICTED: uncharacterized protein LOC108562017 [Nicrophorus vespilloides]|uniref:Uncharacterized protein LOC108562017 n=1 Tax=Nicrophorus vespilloides TaxID=110193 RepID=A0ABM1MM80_NICVS|nr:PREDICTED: uncharacterized protein LOC108562017 [Nicrophorus vespilloides]XP_017775679.1 PREDICTED: uncharacterized protein LOC108562017 [Nicrophorus vespilloides]XP_017775680.1 PREDICTED: uncharacterized protein LOC108562017 [Nicrophorus vespilloides]